MTALILNQMGQIAGMVWRGVTRDKTTWLVLTGAAAICASGGWWMDFNFGSEVGRFLINYALSAQALLTVLMAIVFTIQTTVAEKSDGTLMAAMAQGIRPWIWVVGQIVGLGRWVALFILISSAAIVLSFHVAEVALPLPALVHGAVSHFGIGLVVITFTRWFASFLGSIAVVGVAAGLFTVLGYLKPLTEDSGSVGWWLTRPIPNLAWMGETPLVLVAWDLGHTLLALLYAFGFVAAFVALSARALSRHEF